MMSTERTRNAPKMKKKIYIILHERKTSTKSLKSTSFKRVITAKGKVQNIKKQKPRKKATKSCIKRGKKWLNDLWESRRRRRIRAENERLPIIRSEFIHIVSETI